ncbi:hypothetical protein WDL1P1_00300 (plasmid) [Variovorax sp. WDL1]|nr:hypothetical protein APY03_0914 [Variovorax sp. WDL1]PNG50256.1 hypothetical protein CHC06_05879 [Variovorax sp. B2]PNG51129.1 hypothetical protein CHC07_05785 [Variovorax sp. B4]VTV17330.1 hypothetical protein WDL1P1_00300 [Variovorax sp. WDL1]
MQLAQKITKLRTLQPTPGGMNELFYQARNLAIEALLLRLENQLLRSGFPAICAWNESSFSDPSIYIQLPNPKEGASWDVATCTLRVLRSKERAPDFVSGCVYVVKGFSAVEHWRGKQPAKVVAFREAVTALHDSGHLAAEVLKVNFPFERGFHSTF